MIIGIAVRGRWLNPESQMKAVCSLPELHIAEAWDVISRYIYTALQGGSIMHGWTKDDRVMIACCNDGTRPVIFKIERLDCE